MVALVCAVGVSVGLSIELEAPRSSLRMPNFAKVDKEATTSTGLRPLHLAAEGGHLESVRYLLDFGAQRKAESPSGTPFDLAKRRSEDEYGYSVLMELLDWGG